jgi:hypothetical protein
MGEPPGAAALQQRLPAGSETLGFLARLLSDGEAQEGDVASSFGIRERLAHLERSWLEKRKNHQLARAIHEAQRAGDTERLQALIAERSLITNRRYRGD